VGLKKDKRMDGEMRNGGGGHFDVFNKNVKIEI
jgi:hypothetical protein